MTEAPGVSTASVATDRPARYAKQLVSHLSRRIEGSWSDDEGRGRLDFPAGHGELTALDGALALRIEAPAADLPRLEDVVGRHLVRFGARDELVVAWQRSDGTPGAVFRNDEPEPGT